MFATLDPHILVGKTIKSVNTQFANCWHLEFEDETTAVISTVGGDYGIYKPTLESAEKYTF